MRWLWGALAPMLVFTSAGVAQQTLPGDTVVLSLAEAVARAAGESEEVRLARSQVDLAEVQIRTVRSNAFRGR